MHRWYIFLLMLETSHDHQIGIQILLSNLGYNRKRRRSRLGHHNPQLLHIFSPSSLLEKSIVSQPQQLPLRQKTYALKKDSFVTKLLRQSEARAVSSSILFRTVLIVCFAILKVDSDGTLDAGIAR